MTGEERKVYVKPVMLCTEVDVQEREEGGAPALERLALLVADERANVRFSAHWPEVVRVYADGSIGGVRVECWRAR